MAVVRSAGGPGRAPYRQEWRGAAVLESWKQQIGSGVQDLAQDILADLHQTIHIVTGEMRRQAFADVSVDATKRTIRAGSAVEYALYEELGTSRRPGHPMIRLVLDRAAPKLTQYIARARGGR